jgi:capsular exopolysaccharide synthesis family protein
VSANLALSAATSGLKVVIIGADLRKPKMHEYFDINNEKGLSNYLVGNANLDEVIKMTEDGLRVITSGPNPPNPLELLDSPRFNELLTELKATFDLVLIDTSPFMLVADARILFRKVDVNLVVMRSEFSKRNNLKLVKEMLAEYPNTRFGVILNDQKIETRYGYGSRTGYNGYGYYDEA